MFEIYQVPGFYISSQPILSLYATGRTIGLVLDSGMDHTQIVPVSEGGTIAAAVSTLDLAGQQLSDALGSTMAQQDASLSSSTLGLQTVDAIKEALCYVAPKAGVAAPEEETYTLPDGRSITLQDERWQVPEAFFNPGAIQSDQKSFQQAIVDAVQASDSSLQSVLFENIVLVKCLPCCFRKFCSLYRYSLEEAQYSQDSLSVFSRSSTCLHLLRW